MSLHLLSIGTAVPAFQIDQGSAAELAVECGHYSPTEERMVEAIYRRSGVTSRGSVVLQADRGSLLQRQAFFAPAVSREDRGPTTAQRMQQYRDESSPLALAAASTALRQAAMEPAAISDLVTVSCTGFHAPGWDVDLIRELDLPRSTSRTHVGFMGCHGAMNGLRVARALAESRPSASVLICVVELCSLHHQYAWNSADVVGNALFADGAAAVVATARPGDASKHGSDGSGNGRSSAASSAQDSLHRFPSSGPAGSCEPGRPWELVGQGSVLLDELPDAIGWEVGDHGFRMTLSTRTPDLIHNQLRPWLQVWLAAQGLTIDAVRSWAIHPGGPRVLDACREALDLDAGQLEISRQILACRGNMSACTVLFILEQLRREAAEGPCVALAFGPGVTVEAALFR